MGHFNEASLSYTATDAELDRRDGFTAPGHTMFRSDWLKTDCAALNWMAQRATEYFTDDISIVYRFRGTVPARMRIAACDWLREQGASYHDGGSRASLTKTIESEIYESDGEVWVHETKVSLSRGTYHGTVNSVELLVSIYDYPLTPADIAEELARTAA